VGDAAPLARAARTAGRVNQVSQSGEQGAHLGARPIGRGRAALAQGREAHVSQNGVAQSVSEASADFGAKLGAARNGRFNFFGAL
jgi:hypothetical protein